MEPTVNQMGSNGEVLHSLRRRFTLLHDHMTIYAGERGAEPNEGRQRSHWAGGAFYRKFPRE